MEQAPALPEREERAHRADDRWPLPNTVVLVGGASLLMWYGIIQLVVYLVS